jgi:hypothetical protein
LSSIDTGQKRHGRRTNCPREPDQKSTLSSLQNLVEPHVASGKETARSNEETDERGSEGTDEVVAFADHDEAITNLARNNGAPSFVYEGSAPWRAWLEYRERNGIPGSLPTRQHMHRGRLRVGWDAPTLWPPGSSGGRTRA